MQTPFFTTAAGGRPDMYGILLQKCKYVCKSIQKHFWCRKTRSLWCGVQKRGNNLTRVV